MVDGATLEARGQQIRERVMQERAACELLEGSMRDRNTMEQMAAAIEAADQTLVDHTTLQRARDKLQARERQEKQRVRDFKDRIKRCTTSAQVQACITSVEASGIDDAELLELANKVLLARQLGEQKEEKRKEAAERARKDLEMFMGDASGMQCPGCRSRKLHGEFLQYPLTSRCAHLQQRCMRCVMQCLDGKMECPDPQCRAKVTPAEREVASTR